MITLWHKVNKGAYKSDEKQKPWGCKREREREREPQFSKINRNENKGIKFAFICDKLKDRIKL